MHQLLHLKEHEDLLFHYLNLPWQAWHGGGSNILISNDFDGIVLKNSIKGIHINLVLKTL